MGLKKSIIFALFLCLLLSGSVSATSDTNDTLISELTEKPTHADTHQADKTSRANDIINENKDTKLDDKISSSTTDTLKSANNDALISSSKTNANYDIIKEEGKTKSFTDLNNSISGNISNHKYELKLDCDYKYQSSDNFTKGIIIDGAKLGDNAFTIKGEGHTIDGSGQARIFQILNNGHLIIENLNLIHGQGQNETLSDGNKWNIGGAIVHYGG